MLAYGVSTKELAIGERANSFPRNKTQIKRHLLLETLQTPPGQVKTLLCWAPTAPC